MVELNSSNSARVLTTGNWVGFGFFMCHQWSKFLQHFLRPFFDPRPLQLTRTFSTTPTISTVYTERENFTWLDNNGKLDEPTLREVTAISRNMLFVCARGGSIFLFLQTVIGRSIGKKVTCMMQQYCDYRKCDSLCGSVVIVGKCSWWVGGVSKWRSWY